MRAIKTTATMDKITRDIQKIKAEYFRRLICRALDLPEAGYYHTVFNKGMEWVARNMGLNDDSICNVIGSCQQYWAWWRNQWELRDARYVEETGLRQHSELPFTGNVLVAARELYADAHCPEDLKIVPHREAINEVHAALREFNKMEVERLKKLIYGNNKR